MPATPAIRLRPATEADQEFLRQLYASTRADELAALDWSPRQKEEFLTGQFRAQDGHYREQFADARFQVVELAGRPIGRLYVHRRPTEIRILDISLLPAYRGRGIGSALMQEILAEGDEAGLPVSMHVMINNPALGLYGRLGFQEVESNGVYRLMERRPGTPGPATVPGSA